jgi:hypothetical protein
MPSPIDNAVTFIQNFLGNFGSGMTAVSQNTQTSMSNAQAGAQTAADNAANDTYTSMVNDIIDGTSVTINVVVEDNGNVVSDVDYTVYLLNSQFDHDNGVLTVNRPITKPIITVTI